jgi:hypothetical protein
MVHNKWLCVIQKTAPMELKNKIIAHLIERHKKGELSNDNIVQIIESIGSIIGLNTIQEYAKINNKSYNGVKNFGQTKQMFGVKLAYDKDVEIPF